MHYDTWALEDARIRLIDGDRGKNYPKQEDFSGSGHCVFLSAKNVTSSGFQFTETIYIGKDRHSLERGDIVLTTRGTIGNVAFYDSSIDYPVIRINSGMIIVRADPEAWNARFLYYVLTSDLMQDQIRSLTSGSAVPQLPARDLKRFKLPRISLPLQNKIESIISSIVDRIKINHQINQTLEQMAQAIFKSWFVDFEPVKAKIAALEAGGSEDDALLAAMQAIAGSALFTTDIADTDAPTQLARLQAEHPEQYATLRATAELFPSAMQESELGEIPEGWEAGSIGDVATARGGYAFKGSQFEEYGNPVVKIKNIVGDGTVKLTGTQCVDDAVAETAYRFQLNDGDLVMAMTGATVGKTGLVLTLGEKVLLNQRVAVFQSKYFGSKISWFLFCLFARKDIFDVVVGTAQGSAQPNISSSGIEAVPIVVPAYEVLEQYLSVTDGLFKFWLENNRQSENLSSLRDTLLPKLLSGELSISAATDQITQAEEAIDV